MPIVVGEAQLRAGVGVLSPADHAGTFRPGVQVDPAGQLAHLRAMADVAVGVDCWGPDVLGLGEDRLADMGVDRHPQREPDLVVAEVPGELGAGPGAVASDQHRPVPRGPGQLRQGEIDQLDQIISAASRGVARPQQARQRLAGSVAAVQVGQQRVEPERSLVGPRRALLGVAMGQDQGRIGVDDQQLDLWLAAGGPGTSAGMGPGGPQPGQPVRVGGDSLDHPPGGRGRGHQAEQLRLITQDRQVGEAVAAIGQHHRQIPQHRRVRMAAPAARLVPAQRPGQPDPVGQLSQQRRPGMADHASAVGGDFDTGR